MEFKVLKFKESVNANNDYQLDGEELKFELESKNRKWDSLEDNFETVIASSIFG